MAAIPLWVAPATRALARAAATSLGFRGVSLTLLCLCQLLLARSLGAAAFGILATALAWNKALSVATTLGMERVVVREIAAYRVRSDFPRWRGLVQWTRRMQVGAALLAAIVAAAALPWLVPDPDWMPVFWMALALLPLSALMRVSNHVLSGMQRPLLAQAPELLLQPLLFAGLLGAGILSTGLGAESAMALQLSAAAVATLCAVLLLRGALPPAVREAQPLRETRAWTRPLPAMIAITGAYSLSAALPVLLLGALQGPEAAGIMAVTRSLADMALVPGMAFGAVLSPALGRLAAEKDEAGLQRHLTLFARGVGAATLPVVLGLAIFGGWVLGWFGAAFAAGSAALTMLACANLVAALAGSNILLLVMTSHERMAALVSLFYVPLTASLCAALIPWFGLTGAAAGAAASLVLWNLALAAAVRSVTGMKPTAFAPLAAAPAEARDPMAHLPAGHEGATPAPDAECASPLVSVIMPVWNRDWCVARAIDSVLAQTYRPIELIVIDDGSTDRTADVVMSYGVSVRLIRQAHGGHSRARNLGLEHARGELIAFADSDDAWFPDRLARQVPMMRRREVGLVFGDCVHVAEARLGAVPTGDTSFGRSPPRRGRVASKLAWRNFVPLCTVLVRRSCLEEIGGFREANSLSADYLAWFRIALRHELDHVDVPLAFYTVHSNGISADLGRSLAARIDHFSAELAATRDEPVRAMLRRMLFNLSLHLALATMRGRARNVAEPMRLAVRTAWQSARLAILAWSGAFILDQVWVRAQRRLA